MLLGQAEKAETPAVGRTRIPGHLSIVLEGKTRDLGKILHGGLRSKAALQL